jgi:hypothetical protein
MVRAITAHAMLRRRGVPSIVYYGAAVLPEKGLEGHAWVVDGKNGVVGHQQASKYKKLASFPKGQL